MVPKSFQPLSQAVSQRLWGKGDQIDVEVVLFSERRLIVRWEGVEGKDRGCIVRIVILGTGTI